MTHFLKDILRQPVELERSLAFLTGAGAEQLERAARLIEGASYVFVTGIGSSWHASMSAAAIFHAAAKPVYLIDAAELLHFGEIPQGSVVIMLSRTGKSIEIVRLVDKARAAGASIIGITNGSDGALSREADVSLLLEVEFDHGISVNTYSTLALAAGVLAGRVTGRFDRSAAEALNSGVRDAAGRMNEWREQVENTSWLDPQAAYYFLARGGSLGTCYEARLLWEEGVKHAATAMGTGGFRHGPQEIVTAGIRFAIWLDAEKMRGEDLAVARDLTRMGAEIAVVGQGAGDSGVALAFDLPKIPADFQHVIDGIPAQLLAERLSRMAGVNCDAFRYCSYIVEDEGGLLKT